MKKIILISAALLLCVYYCFSRATMRLDIDEDFCEETLSAAMYLDGNLITGENVVLHHRNDFSSYCELPFYRLLDAMGWDAYIKNESETIISRGSQRFVLNMDEWILCREGDRQNLFVPPCGGKTVWHVTDGELIVDNTTAWTLFDAMGIAAHCKLDHKNKAVRVEIPEHAEK